MTPIILFRKALAEEYEFETCCKYFPNTVELRSKIPPLSLVIPRYSYLPYPLELEKDLAQNNSTLINSYQQHKWIANFEWYEPLKQFTPKTYFDYNFFSAPNDQQYVVKGATNSRKNQWNTMMFAQNKQDALRIAADLKNDGLICNQDIIYREYVPLQAYEIGINGLPFTNEWRFFFYKEELLTYGYYWSTAKNTNYYRISSSMIFFANKVANIIKNYVNFFIIDIAETQDGRDILIEINDGCMSGLSECSADELYYNLKKVLS